MKAQLTFNLEDEDDKAKFQEIASENATNVRLAVHSFSQEVLRKYRKYGVPLNEVFDNPDQIPTDPQEICQRLATHVEEKFYQILNEYDARIE